MSGAVRVTASHMIATYVLPEIVAKLMRAHPQLEIELVASDMTENLLKREADIAVRMLAPRQEDLIARRLGEMQIGLYASAEYISAHGQPEAPQDLSAHVMLGYDRSDLILKAMARMGMPAEKSDFGFRTDDQAAYFEAIAAGVGIGAAPHGISRSRGLQNLLPELQIPALPVWLVAHRDLLVAPAVRVVFDTIAENLQIWLKSAG